MTALILSVNLGRDTEQGVGSDLELSKSDEKQSLKMDGRVESKGSLAALCYPALAFHVHTF